MPDGCREVCKGGLAYCEAVIGHYVNKEGQWTAPYYYALWCVWSGVSHPNNDKDDVAESAC